MNFSEQDNKRLGDAILAYLQEHARALTTDFLCTRFDVDKQRLHDVLDEMLDAGLVTEKSVLRNRVKARRYFITRLGERYVAAGGRMPPEE